jgi:cellulose synthase operon protein C
MSKAYRNTSLAVVVIATLQLSGCDRLRSVDAIVERGQSQYEKGNYRAAGADFKTALERDSGNLKARAGLARVSYHLADFATAQDALQAVLAAGGNTESDLRLLKYRVLLVQQDYAGALKSLEADTALADVDRLRFEGEAQAGLGQNDRARELLDQALKLQPDNVEVLLTSARLHGANNEVAAASENVEKALGKQPDNATGLLLKGGLLVAQSNLDGAKQALEKAESLSKTQLNWADQARLYALLADISLRDDNQADATKWTAALAARAPKSPLAPYLRARLALLQNNANEAITQLQKANQLGNYLPARLLLVTVQLAKNTYGQAEEQLNQLRRDYPDNVEVRKLLAQLYLATNRAGDARKILPESDAGATPDAQTDWLRGQAMIATGSQDAGLALLEKSVKASPDSAGRSLQLARTYIASGQRDKALALLNAMPDSVGTQRQGLLVVASVMGKPLADARRDLDALLQRNSKDSVLHSATAAALVQLGDTARAQTLFEQAVKLDANNTDGRIGLAALLANNKRYDEAQTQLRTVLTQDAKLLRARMLLANVLLAKGDKAGAVKELEQAVGADAAAVEPRLQLAQLAFADNDLQRGRALVDQAVVASNKSATVLGAAGTLLFQAKQYEDALTRYQEAIAAGNTAARIAAAEVQLALGQEKEARQMLEQAAADRQTQLAAVAKLAELDAKTGQLDRALKRIDGLSGVAPAMQNEMRGDAQAIAKQYDMATKSYDNAIAQVASQRLALKAYRVRTLGKLANPTAPLTSWVARHPNDVAVLRVLAQHAQTSDDQAGAARYLEQVLAGLPTRDPAVLNDLAWAYQSLKDKRAEGLAKEAYDAAPTVPAIADTYAWILVQGGKATVALPILQKLESDKGDAEIQYHLAVAQARSGNNADARLTLQKALASKQSFASRSEAEKLLASLADAS